jgi:hypothetical protein
MFFNATRSGAAQPPKTARTPARPTTGPSASKQKDTKKHEDTVQKKAGTNQQGAKKQTPRTKQNSAAKQKALRLLRQGNAKLDGAYYLEALQLYKKAFAIYSSPKLHFNIAQTYKELGRFLAALRHYERFVKNVPKTANPRLWQLAHERIFALEGRIGRVTLQVNVADAEVTIDGRVVGTTPLAGAVRLLPGSHTAVILKDGFEKKVVRFKVKKGQALVKRIKLLREEEAAATKRIVQKLAAERKAAQLRLAQQRARTRLQRRRKKKIMWISGLTALAVGGAAAVVGGVCGYLTTWETEQMEKVDRGTPWNEVKDHFRRAEIYRKTAIATGVAGGALLVAGTVLTVLAARIEERATPNPASNKAKSIPARTRIFVFPSPDAVSLGVGFTF